MNSTGSSSHTLSVADLACGYDGVPVLSGLNFSLETGSVKCLLGPNGAGKTTLFKTLLGFIKPCTGAILYDGLDMSAWSRKQFGQVMGYIPQNHETSFGFTVLEVVLMGRTPHLSSMGNAGKADERIALEALEELGIAHLAQRDYTMLSGGERQMVLVARVLAQQPAFMVMDEPTSALDMGNQAKVLERVHELSAKGYGVLMTTHDPNQALLLDGEVICVGRDGSFVAGNAREILTEDLLTQLCGHPIRMEGGVYCSPVLNI